jgi:hypothetical protein
MIEGKREGRTEDGRKDKRKEGEGRLAVEGG